MMTPSPFRHAMFGGRIGVARVDITPPVGIYCRNWGAGNQTIAKGIHRPLTLTALAIFASDQDSDPLVLVDADLGWWRGLNVWDRFQSGILDLLGLKPARFLFALAHTHSAPPLADPDPTWPGSDLLAAYQQRVYEATIDAIQRATATAMNATMTWHTGRCALAADRDLPDPAPKQDRWLCGFNPGIAADDTLLVGRVSDPAGRIIATIVNYACHPTTLAWQCDQASPDYVGAMRQTVEDATEAAPALFLQGASGELSPRNGYTGDLAVADRNGRQLGHAVLAVLADMEAPGTQLAFDCAVESGAPLGVWRSEPVTVPTAMQAMMATVDLELKSWPSADELQSQWEMCEDRVLAERLRRKLTIRRILGDEGQFSVPVYAWRLGDVLLVGSMCEAYSCLQQDLRQRFPDHAVVCMNLINGSIGYLPPSRMYARNLYQASQTPFVCGCLEAMRDAMERQIISLLSA